MQPKRPRINPLIFALALAAVLMIWSVFTSGTGMSGGSTMSYSTVVHYFEHNQVTKFTLDRNTSVITLTLKEGDLDLPQTTAAWDAVVFVVGFHGRGEELGRYRDGPLQAALCLRFH